MMNTKRWIFILLSSYIFGSATAQVIDLPDVNFKACLVADPTVNTNGDNEIQLSEAENAEKITCNDQSIATISGIEHFTNVTSLWVMNNSIEHIDVSQNLMLENLACSDNLLDSLDLEVNLELQFINAYDNDISHLKLGAYQEIRTIRLRGNVLTELPLDSFPSLNFLDISNNDIPYIDFAKTPNLTSLHYTNSDLSQIDLSVLPILETLIIKNNDLPNIDVSHNLKLVHLDVDNNFLNQIDLSSNDSLEVLKVSDNIDMDSLDLSHNHNLKILEAKRSELKIIDLTKNDNLQVLDVEANQLQYLDLSQLSELHTVIVRRNELKYLDVANGNNLNMVRMMADVNPDLFCINVDEGLTIDTSTMEWVKDEWASFNADCCASSSSIIEVELCEGEIIESPFGNDIYSVTGMFSDTLFNDFGCDSIVHTNVEYITFVNEIEQVENQLIASPGNVSYQWIDCSDQQPIPGETQNVYTPETSGSYAVEVSDETCLHVSACFDFVLTSVMDAGLSEVLIYPNPNKGQFVVNLGEHDQNMEIQIVNTLGVLVEKIATHRKEEVMLSISDSGVYFVRIKNSDQESKVFKIVVDK